MESEGILCVFPTFHTAAWEQKIRCPAADDLFRVSLSPNVTCITVKDKARAWEPSKEETYPIIYNGVKEAIRDHGHKTGYPSRPLRLRIEADGHPLL